MAPAILWMDEILHHFEAMVETIAFVGIYRGIIMPGFLRWSEMDLVHPL